MLLYDVYYKDRSFDRCRPLPRPAADIVRAVNVNWDRHILVPVRKGRKWEWVRERETEGGEK